MTKSLELKFHGRILDSLGIQMYQSPVAALAELVANAWDADAHEVNIVLPKALNEQAVFSLDIKALRDESFVSTTAKPIDTLLVEGPDAARIKDKGPGLRRGTDGRTEALAFVAHAEGGYESFLRYGY